MQQAHPSAPQLVDLDPDGHTLSTSVLLTAQSVANLPIASFSTPLTNAPLLTQKCASNRAQPSSPTFNLSPIATDPTFSSLNPSASASSSPTPHCQLHASSNRVPDSAAATDSVHKGLRPKASYHQSLLNLRDELFFRPPDSASLPRALDMASSTELDTASMTEPSEYDWACFITAYALGRWEPHKPPPPPLSFSERQTPPLSLASSLPDVRSDPHISSIFPSGSAGIAQMVLSSAAPQGTSSPHVSSDGSTLLPRKGDIPPQTTSPPSTASSSLSSPMHSPPGYSSLAWAPSTSRRSSTANIASSIPHRLRSSFADIRTSTGARPLLEQPPTSTMPPVVPHADATTAAAAMRWAGARINIAPLALPSPERELTDPFRNARTAIPGLNSPDVPLGPQSPRHRQRLGSFWEGTIDVDGATRPSSSTLSSIEGSPPSTPPDANNSDAEREPPSASSVAASPPYVTPASVPLRGYGDDYFGVTAVSVSPEPITTSLDSVRQHEHVSPGLDAAEASSVATRRVNPARQTSCPPANKASGPSVEVSPPSRVVDAGVGRVPKEEAMFLELGYLAPPYPPDELDRRRALFQFNIWNTGPDINFERIEHLTKLVFSTKTVIISLIDGNEQWMKSASGWMYSTFPRMGSICAHAILQCGDEPMVIPDTHADWRFAKNPLVTGSQHVRFYAGAPLRTQEGFNIGTLAIMDDTPRVEFSPRQRHTLKEFAAIAMREMELWRDKIQLRIRDRIQTSMEQFTRECLEIDSETGPDTTASQRVQNSLSMDTVYQRAAKLVKKTLDVEGALVMDMSHGEVLETVGAEANMSFIVHSAEDTTTYQVQGDVCVRIWDMFLKYPDGRVFEALVPAPLRPFVPNATEYALCVPIFNIDKRPFAMLCAYNSSEHGRRYLEGHELSYLRAIGVVILSAVLKRRMTLADKAKSLFISNISHELRTPLHGILAAAELLSDTQLNHTQSSFLQTVQACGTSLVETVNHVLDFTKLSGNSKAGGVEHVIRSTKIDVLQLIEEAVEGSWIGHRARMLSRQQESEIGSLYAPPRQDGSGKKLVEIVIEIGDRLEGWLLKLEKGGIRRVLMNVFGNSLKFTTDGYVHVIIRQLPSTPDVPPNKVKLELVVVDTGKGISQDFLKNQLFHPFSQENPMQTGTGLGLAIVNSIVQSKGVDGKVDVWSAENMGTEIKVTFSAETVKEDESSLKITDTLNQGHTTNVSLVGFDDPHRGVQLLRRVLTHYLVSWWDFQITSPGSLGDIVIANEDLSALQLAIEQREISRPFILLTVHRGERHLTATVTEFERLGGFCRILYKPGGPSRLRHALKLCIHALKISRRSSPAPEISRHPSDHISSPPSNLPAGVTRRNSEEPSPAAQHSDMRRPSLGRRAITVHPVTTWNGMPTHDEEDDDSQDGSQPGRAGRVRSMSQSQTSTSPTIPVGDTGGSLLKSSIGALESRKNVRVLVVEDNDILRNLLTRWLSSKGYEFREAVDGREGVHLYETDGQFDVILLDLSMPVLDGYGATTQIRKIEASRSEQKSHILALTGMSSLEDKRKAFEAGVDGYLVKPVAFKTISYMFSRLGIT